MKKIIAFTFMFAFLILGSQTAFASGPFNGQSGDCPAIAIGNDTTQDGVADGQWNCWTKQLITANAGDVINVVMWYHNNTNSTLNNVGGTLSQSSTGPGNSYSFTGVMYSDQGNTTMGTVNLNLTSSQTLTYSSVHLMKDKNAIISNTDSTIPSGQSPSVMLNNGKIQLGDVPQGWNDYGELLVVFKIGNVQNSTCSISNFNANPSSINSGSPVTLTWNSSNCTSFTVNGVNANSGYVVNPTTSTTYTLIGYSSSGASTSASTYVTVNSNNSAPSVSTYSPTYIGSNSATISGYANYSNYNGYNNSPMNAWLEFPCYGTQYGYQSSVNTANLSASIYNLSPNTTYSYCAVAQVNGGQVYRGNTVSFTTIGGYSNVVATTTLATNIARDSATLNGLISNTTGSSNTYFEYGSTASLGYKTAVNTTSSGTNYPISQSISGLSSNTTYYFRAVAESNGVAYRGVIQLFDTLGSTAKPVIIQGRTVVGTESPIMLKLENRYPNICNGDTIDYTVTYRNIGTKLLTKPMIQVVVPTGVTITNSSRGTYDATTHTLSIPIEDLQPKTEGVIYVQAHADLINTNNSQVISTVLLVYTSPNGAQENAIAYSVNNYGNCNSVLGAAALFSGWGFNGLTWLLLFIIVAMIAVLATRSYRQKGDRVPLPPFQNLH